MSEHRINLDQLAKVRDGSGHSVFGASGYAHFLLCLGALIPNLLIKDDGNPDAAYGTVAHMVAELWLRVDVKPTWLLGTVHKVDGFEIEVDEVMLAHAQVCVDRCQMEPGFHLIERHGDYSDLTPIPKQGGTLDFAALTLGHALVHDHKFGRHETIFAIRNFQLMLYAYMIFLEWDWLYDFQTFTIRICQPRIDHEDEWTFTRTELLEFAAWAKERMHAAWDIDAPRTAGEQQCKHCKVRGSCTANAMLQVQLTEGVFGDTTVTAEQMNEFKERLDDCIDEFELSTVRVGQLTTAQIATLYGKRRTAEKFWKSLAGELFNRAQAGEDIQEVGYKLVEGRSKRQFANATEAADALVEMGVPRDEVMVEKIVSPAQAEKALIKIGRKRKELPNLLEGLVYKPPGKAAIAPVHDRRTSIADLSAYAFGDASDDPEIEED